MGGFVILDVDSKEVIWVGQYYGPRQTNNEAKSFAIQDALLKVTPKAYLEL